MTSATSFEHRSAIAPLALAAVLLLGGSSAALAQSFTQSGANSTSPVNLLPFVGSPTFLDFTGNQVNIGNSAPGSFAALAGAVLLADGLTIASGEHAVGSVNFSGAGTRVELGGGPVNRLVVGNWGIGSLVVSGGALLDATVNAAACAAPVGRCYNAIGAIVAIRS